MKTGDGVGVREGVTEGEGLEEGDDDGEEDGEGVDDGEGEGVGETEGMKQWSLLLAAGWSLNGTSMEVEVAGRYTGIRCSGVWNWLSPISSCWRLLGASMAVMSSSAKA